MSAPSAKFSLVESSNSYRFAPATGPQAKAGVRGKLRLLSRLGLVDAQQEGLQALRRLGSGRGRRALDAHGEREQRENSGDSESGRHGKTVFGRSSSVERPSNEGLDELPSR